MSANMKRENMVTSNVRELPGRITRARAASLHTSGQMPPIKPPTQQSQKQAVRTNPKRAATDENSTKAAGNACMQRKRRAVLQDVTNACCKPSYGSCFNATKIQVNVLLVRFVHKCCANTIIRLVYADVLLRLVA